MKKNDKSFSDWTGDKLKDHRKSLSLSQIDMAKKLGMSERGYRCYETDHYRIPLSVKYAVLYLSEAKKQKKGNEEVINYVQSKAPLT